MKNTAEFVTRHLNDDTTRLILDRKKYEDIDMDLAVNCIESRRKLKGKVQEWYDEPMLVFPAKLSAEQCSSSATGRYKAELAENIANTRNWRIADLTGGLGVDSWYFSQKAGEVLYNEMQSLLCDAAAYNFGILKADNIRITNHKVSPGSLNLILEGFSPDIVYMDPARRGEGGKKVFLIEDCTPDVLTIKDEIFAKTRHILIKLSPMADISMVCNRLGDSCREVHVVASAGECKELLIWMDREWRGGYSIKAVEIHNDGSASEFTFLPSEEQLAAGNVSYYHHNTDGSMMLFEPGKALMKAGAFNLTAEKFGISKLGRSTHYYMTDDTEKAAVLKNHGKVFRIIETAQLDKRNIKEFGRKYPKSEVTARNIPMDTDTLRKKTGVTSGDDAHIFGLKSDYEGNLLIAAKPF